MPPIRNSGPGRRNDVPGGALPTSHVPESTEALLPAGLYPSPPPSPVLGFDPNAPRRHTKKMDEGHIPRPPNRWLAFRSSLLAKLREHRGKVEVVEEMMKHQDKFSVYASQIWQSMEPSEKAPFEEWAQKAKRRHAELYPWYSRSKRSTAKKGKGTRPKTTVKRGKKSASAEYVLSMDFTATPSTSFASSLPQLPLAAPVPSPLAVQPGFGNVDANAFSVSSSRLRSNAPDFNSPSNEQQAPYFEFSRGYDVNSLQAGMSSLALQTHQRPAIPESNPFTFSQFSYANAEASVNGFGRFPFASTYNPSNSSAYSSLPTHDSMAFQNFDFSASTIPMYAPTMPALPYFPVQSGIHSAYAQNRVGWPNFYLQDNHGMDIGGSASGVNPEVDASVTVGVDADYALESSLPSPPLSSSESSFDASSESSDSNTVDTSSPLTPSNAAGSPGSAGVQPLAFVAPQAPQLDLGASKLDFVVPMYRFEQHRAHEGVASGKQGYSPDAHIENYDLDFEDVSKLVDQCFD